MCWLKIEWHNTNYTGWCNSLFFSIMPCAEKRELLWREPIFCNIKKLFINLIAKNDRGSNPTSKHDIKYDFVFIKNQRVFVWIDHTVCFRRGKWTECGEIRTGLQTELILSRMKLNLWSWSAEMYYIVWCNLCCVSIYERERR